MSPSPHIYKICSPIIAKKKMEAKRILELMDYLRFEPPRLFRNQDQSSDFEVMHKKTDERVENLTVQNLRIRSYSDHCIAVDFKVDSPRSVITKPKLQKIPSGEEAVFEHSFIGREMREMREKTRTKKRYGRGEREGRGGMSRSLSALEFEELKGFMDLGFEFNEGETNPSIVSIVPGLRRLRKEGRVSRPYLSEAWGELSGRRDVVMNLRIPYGKNEMDMKEHLKVWAHVVASSVK